MTLYFSSGACSLASHIGLEETGAPYEIKRSAGKGTARGRRTIEDQPAVVKSRRSASTARSSARTRRYSLTLQGGFPEKRLMPTDRPRRARCIGTMCWFSRRRASLLPAVFATERFAEGEAAQAAVKETGRKSFWTNCQEIDSMIQGNDWIMGSEYTLVDPYALVFYGWGARGGFPMKELSAYTAWQDRMTKRPTVQKSVESEQNVST